MSLKGYHDERGFSLLETASHSDQSLSHKTVGCLTFRIQSLAMAMKDQKMCFCHPHPLVWEILDTVV